MPNLERISVEVPVGLARSMRARVAAGRFASEDEAVASALEAAEEEEYAVERWLRGPVAEAYDAVEDGSAVLYSPEEVRARLRG